MTLLLLAACCQPAHRRATHTASVCTLARGCPLMWWARYSPRSRGGAQRWGPAPGRAPGGRLPPRHQAPGMAGRPRPAAHPAPCGRRPAGGRQPRGRARGPPPTSVPQPPARRCRGCHVGRGGVVARWLGRGGISKLGPNHRPSPGPSQPVPASPSQSQPAKKEEGVAHMLPTARHSPAHGVAGASSGVGDRLRPGAAPHAPQYSKRSRWPLSAAVSSAVQATWRLKAAASRPSSPPLPLSAAARLITCAHTRHARHGTGMLGKGLPGKGLLGEGAAGEGAAGRGVCPPAPAPACRTSCRVSTASSQAPSSNSLGPAAPAWVPPRLPPTPCGGGGGGGWREQIGGGIG